MELSRREVKIGFNLRGEVSVVLEPEAVCDDLQGEPLGNKSSGEEHPVPPEQLLVLSSPFVTAAKCSLTGVCRC